MKPGSIDMIIILFSFDTDLYKEKRSSRKSHVRIQDLKRKKHEGDFQKLVSR